MNHSFLIFYTSMILLFTHDFSGSRLVHGTSYMDPGLSGYEGFPAYAGTGILCS